jgi:endoglucanase
MHIHHRPSSADGIAEPQPGYLAGGPNLDTFADCPDDKIRSRTHPAISFVDLECSYSTNEIAINWNAPLVYLAGAFD